MNFEKRPPPQLDQVSLQILTQTPLHYACYTGDGHLIDTLIGRALLYNNNDGEASEARVAALVSEEDSLNGWTPAHWAAFYGQLSCLMKLNVKPHIGFDTPTHRSNTSPLHLASQSGSVLCVKWLLQCGSSKNKQDFMGETPLHKAAKAGNTDCAAMLIGHGAATDLKNHRGLTPADLAEHSNHLALAQYLKRAAERAEYGGVTKCITPPLPISDLNSSIPLTNTQILSNFSTCHPTFSDSDTSLSSKEQQTINHSNIFMNGEGIHYSCSSDSCDMDETDSEMTDNAVNNNVGFCEATQVFSRMKRSFDAVDDDDSQSHKRRCFVPLSEKSHEERYGNAHNNNIISSYNAVLAMKVEPMSATYDAGKTSNSKSESPVFPQSSMMEHQASLDAQQGYDSTFMTTISSAFH